MTVILADLRQAAAQAEEDASTIAASSNKTAEDKAEARAAAARAASFPEQLLRALGARGRGVEAGGRQYGLALLDVVDSVAAEAPASEECSLGRCVAGQGASSPGWRFETGTGVVVVVMLEV